MLVRKHVKGYVTIKEGKVDITDPCYNKGEWCQKTDVKIKPGDYRCRYYMGSKLEPSDIEEITEIAKQYGHNIEESIKEEEADIKSRCFAIEMQIKGRAFQLNSPKWQEIGEIAVDAGLAGFFWNKPDYSEKEWSEFCQRMWEQKNTNAYLEKDLGFWCNSGYGDGMYGVYAIKENNEIIALKICF